MLFVSQFLTWELKDVAYLIKLPLSSLCDRLVQQWHEVALVKSKKNQHKATYFSLTSRIFFQNIKSKDCFRYNNIAILSLYKG